MGHGQHVFSGLARRDVLEDTDFLDDPFSVADDCYRAHAPHHASLCEHEALLNGIVVALAGRNESVHLLLAPGVSRMHQVSDSRVVPQDAVGKLEDAAKGGIDVDDIAQVGALPGDAHRCVLENQPEQEFALLQLLIGLCELGGPGVHPVLKLSIERAVTLLARQERSRLRVVLLDLAAEP